MRTMSENRTQVDSANCTQVDSLRGEQSDRLRGESILERPNRWLREGTRGAGGRIKRSVAACGGRVQVAQD